MSWRSLRPSVWTDVQLGADHVRVTVPATSANLGPGFDTLGLALELRDEIEVEATASCDVTVEVTGEGASELSRGAEHLVARAIRLGLEHVGAPQTGLQLACRNVVPHGRGLGSSAAAVVGGLLAARGLIAEPSALDDHTLLRLASRMEGHPDNAAPALMGGATIAWTVPAEIGPAGQAGSDEDVHAVPVATDQRIDAVVLVPQDQLATRAARTVLPRVVPHGDAAFNAGRAALLIAALGGSPELLMDATEDRLHQSYRAAAMPASVHLVAALRRRGLAAVISGAGPSVLVLTAAAERDAEDAEIRACVAENDTQHGESGWRLLRPGLARQGGTVERLHRSR